VSQPDKAFNLDTLPLVHANPSLGLTYHEPVPWQRGTGDSDQWPPLKLYLEQTKVFIAGDSVSSEYISMGQNIPTFVQGGLGQPRWVSEGAWTTNRPSGAKKTMGPPSLWLKCSVWCRPVRGGGRVQRRRGSVLPHLFRAPPPLCTGCHLDHGASGVEAGALLRSRSLTR